MICWPSGFTGGVYRRIPHRLKTNVAWVYNTPRGLTALVAESEPPNWKGQVSIGE
jgi:hypothetical protein